MFFVKTPGNLTRVFKLILKIAKNSVFCYVVSKEILKVSQTSQRIVLFVQRAKANAGFFKFYEKTPKINHFLQFS